MEQKATLGFGNNGNFNIGLGNTGNHNIGFGNTGNYNIGIGLTGSHQISFGGLNSGTETKDFSTRESATPAFQLGQRQRRHGQ